MTYPEVIEYLFSRLPMFHRTGPAAYKPGLDNTIALLAMAGQPDKNLRTVHVAGTNGKGSTSHLIASALQEAGYKTGLYTSPHLIDFRERIRINGKPIAQESVIEFCKKFLCCWEEIQPSFFELCVAMCYWYFEKEKVDIAVIETGLGGRLDSTNTIVPDVSVITTIGYDHTNLLGDTLEKIAAEKAGIIKEKIPVVVGRIGEPALSVILQRAKILESNVHSVDMNAFAPATSLLGSYQEENRRTAFLTIEVLRKVKGWEISGAAVERGFIAVVENTGLMGRWQITGREPLTIADVAHNEDGMRSVLEQLKKEPHRKLHFVLGMVGDKDIDRVLRLLPKDALYYFCKANIPRGMDAAKLCEKAGAFGMKGGIYPDVSSAYLTARREAEKDDLVFVGGSVFTVAEIL